MKKRFRASPTREAQRGAAFGVAVLLIVVAVGLLSLCSTPNTPTASQPPVDATPAAARSACRTFLERVMRDPATAEWIEQWNWTTLQNDDSTWSVLAHYRAANGFGGRNLEKTTCVMSNSGDNWQLISRARMQ